MRASSACVYQKSLDNTLERVRAPLQLSDLQFFTVWITLINWRLITNKLAFDYNSGPNKLAFDYKIAKKWL